MSQAPAPVGRRALPAQLVRFAVIGAGSTALHLALFAALLHGGAATMVANGVALVVATVANTAANRAWTFGISGRRRLGVHHGQALLVFAITWTATTLALAVLAHLQPDAGPTTQTVVVAVANVVSTAARFVAMRRWIFTERTPVP